MTTQYTHYICIANENAVFGAGTTIEEAQADAISSIGVDGWGDGSDFDFKRVTADGYAHIFADGSPVALAHIISMGWVEE